MTIRIANSLPDGVEIRETDSYGKGIFVTRSVKQWNVIYEGSCLFFNGNQLDEKDRDHFAVAVGAQKYMVFGFDRYMNHSCDPNVVSIDVTYHENGVSYKMLALRDIKAGEEICEDYLHYEWDECKIPLCQCGSLNCQIVINGFKNLPLFEKLKRISRCEQNVIEKWASIDSRVEIVPLSLLPEYPIDVLQRLTELPRIDPAEDEIRRFCKKNTEKIYILRNKDRFLWFNHSLRDLFWR